MEKHFILMHVKYNKENTIVLNAQTTAASK